MKHSVAKFVLCFILPLAGMSQASRSSAMERNKLLEHDTQNHHKHSKWQAQARISEYQAKSFALAHVAGTVSEVELEHQEGGILIYSVEIKTKEGRNVEAQIDASTGAFLGTEEEHEGDEVESGNDD